MKVLLLSVALLFFTGAQGRHFWQQDEPAQEESMEKILHDGFSILAAVLKSVDFQEIAKEYQIKEKFEAAKKHFDKLEKTLESYSEELLKRFDQQLNEKFPIFSQNVLPVLKEYEDKLEEHVKKFVKEALPVGSDLVSEISKHMTDFFESLESIAGKGRDNVRAEIDSLRVKLEPYVDDVHAEYERYSKNFQDELQKDMKELKESVEKNMAKAKEHLSDKIPDGKEFQERLQKLLKEVKLYLKSL